MKSFISFYQFSGHVQKQLVLRMAISGVSTDPKNTGEKIDYVSKISTNLNYGI